MKNSLNCRKSEMGYVAIVPMIVAMAILAFAYVTLAPFEPISFFSVGAIAMIGLAWCVVYLIRHWKKEDEK